MGQTVSTPQTKTKSIPPPLSDDTDDSEEDEALLLDKILVRGNEEKEVSIVFFDEDEEEVDDNDLYYEEDKDDSFDDFKCFGLPLFSMNFSSVAGPLGNEDEDEDEDEDGEDPKENIASLQMELKVVDAFYNRHTRNAKKDAKASKEAVLENVERATQVVEDSENVPVEENPLETPEKGLQDKEVCPEERDNVEEDEDPRENVESLQRELERAEELVSRRDAPSHRSPSFVNLQQLLFAPSSPATDEDENSSLITAQNGGSSISSSSFSLFSSSSTASGRVVEIYETRTTQLKPQREDEKELVPLERRGVPFRKCRDPSCSCHRPASKHKQTTNHRSRHRDRNRALIEKYHGGDRCVEGNDDHNHNNDDDSLMDSPQKRRSALLRLQKQSAKMMAMDCFECDDRTEVTVGSSSSRYSGYSIRSDCQINTRKNHILDNNVCNNNNSPVDSEFDNRRKGSRSEDLDERFHLHGASLLSEMHRLNSSERLASNAMSSKGSSPRATPQSPISNHHYHHQQQQQHPSPPPLPSRRSFGEGSNHKHKTYPSSLGSQSLRKISSGSLFDDNIDGIPRRCRSEDFIDGSSNAMALKASGLSQSLNGTSQSIDMLHVSLKCGKLSKGDDTTRNSSKRSISATNVTPSEVQFDRATPTEEGKDLEFLESPTCIMEEVHQNGSYPRSRTTQHQHENLLEQLDRVDQQEEEPSIKTTSDTNTHSPAKSTLVDDDPNYCRLFAEREQRLKEYRSCIRILLDEERTDKCNTIPKRNSGKDQKQNRQQRQQRGFQRAMKLADLYKSMGLIHYQQGRYETARHVLQCGVDVLISNRASCIPLDLEVFEESSDPFDDDYSNNYFACAPSRNLPLLPTVDEAAPHLSNAALLLAAELILAQGKILAAQGLWNDTKLSSGRVLQWSAFQKQRVDNSLHNDRNHRQQQQQQHPYNPQYATEKHNKYWRDWGPTIARAQVLFARCCEKEYRPDIAMGYYREALSVQQRILSPGHVQAADTLYRMGNLHAHSGMLGLAGQCYDEALCLYRRHKNQSSTSSSTTSTSSLESCLCADEATALAALGWIFLVQNDLERARALTKEALDGMVRVLGSSHRNVLSLQHQLVCIQNALAFPTRRPNRGFVVQGPAHR